MTNERELLELAAKAMGLKHTAYPTATYEGIFTDDADWWNPLTDQADSADVRDTLEIEIAYRMNTVCAMLARDNSIHAWVDHNGTTEDRSRAVREAVLMVAAEIGRVK